MDSEKVLQLIQLMSETDISYLKLREGDSTITLKSDGCKSDPAILLRINPGSVEKASTSVAAPADEAARVFCSPVTGVFYACASPEDPPFVEVGTPIRPGKPLCIIEAMKMLNEIEADVEGTIAAILVKNGDVVTAGQPLFALN
ncbi:acetyl-CoA carboxylase biotin carboxyl carrier protein [Paraburkholderia rhynchosiae]|uniref:Biotin carboxyl carrier protein of acetyl-CoA carboxylase n=1 Tax=Paraburkholderia rhynchosiae TaxID=487049 RepID=A0A2N7W479_9BURK|nr:biotin/lipoyl-containing protein [Paraburkholderia rhynchosiae]PMS24202.1 acetyl-CoA carboxylase, biotin carboxyl carrier protein [Paraburkholderia rhynchosiae]CAB3737433.1 Biotin carboxyl carrier protein of acetyl-CoA carboxylase [Paraburkholderia rhynchosiae]